MDAEPHVLMMAKRLFQKAAKGAVTVEMDHTPANCRELAWFIDRYPLDMEPDHRLALSGGAANHRETIERLDRIASDKYRPKEFPLAIPPRDYQRRAAELCLERRSLLIADDVGLGKTATSICVLTEPATLPAVVVCLAHLPKQWEREINRFAPDLQTHVVTKASPYTLPTFFGRSPDVLILSYHKLAGWSKVVADYCRSVIYDEVQELRHEGTGKYTAASDIAEKVEYRIGLSATPIYNYGGEIYNVLGVLSPGALGSRDEFFREWCVDSFDMRKAKLKSPTAFGAYLREQHLMLRRTRKDVDRELPSLQRITHEIEADESELKKIEGAARELAEIILSTDKGERGQKMHAAEEFNTLLRQSTGIAKAPYVAAFVDLLVESGEKVVLFGWHRAVYALWESALSKHKPAFYTGSESSVEKQKAVDRFIAGETPILILSLRSGAGLDGLQHVCRTVVFGELDWSPGVHEQCIGRVHRDGQPDPVAAYFLVSEHGADPLMAEVLGIKRDQVDGVRGAVIGPVRTDDGTGIRQLAEKYLKRGAS